MQVNLKMLNNIIEEEDDCFVFFYDEVDPDAHAILSELEGNNITDNTILEFADFKYLISNSINSHIIYRY